MKKGDIVTIQDTSYSKVVTNHGLESGYGYGYGDGEVCNIRKKQGTIIEIGCRFPDPHYYQTQIHTCNDTVVVLDSGEIVFIEERFLELVPPKHTIMIDVKTDGCLLTGNYVEISDKLYKEIKRDSQTK